jgi:hypothetical protein
VFVALTFVFSQENWRLGSVTTTTILVMSSYRFSSHISEETINRSRSEWTSFFLRVIKHHLHAERLVAAAQFFKKKEKREAEQKKKVISQ